jgi:hypothetical protein
MRRSGRWVHFPEDGPIIYNISEIQMGPFYIVKIIYRRCFEEILDEKIIRAGVL